MQNQDNKIPDEYLKVAKSPEIFEACQKIGEKFSLMIDQVGELDAEISDVLVGSSESKDFTDNIMKRLEIGRGMAEQITSEVNSGIMQVLRDKLRQVSENQPSKHADIEAAGNFTIEPEHNSVASAPDVTIHDRQEILSTIEEAKPSSAQNQKYTEPLVDHLLTTPTARPVEKIVVRAPAKPAEVKVRSEASNRPGPDPYREPAI